MQIEELYRLYLRSRTVTTDSRDCRPGSIFFALKGATFNGNRYAAAALEKGCAYAVVDEAGAVTDPRIILVDNALAALQRLARHHRRQQRIPFVGITGTNGKTTTKELVAAVLSRRYRVHYTQGNLNNHIGVPLTLLSMPADTEIAVIEMGANHPGEIAELASIAEPTCGLVTNIGTAHLEGFGSLEGVLDTKRELYTHLLRTGGRVVINRADPMLEEAFARSCRDLDICRTGRIALTYSHSAECSADCSGRVARCAPYVEMSFSCGGGTHHVKTHFVGAYNVANMMAAVAVGRLFSVAEESIASAIASYEPRNNRSQLTITPRNTLVVDAYNANPTSMRAAIENFAMMESPHKVMILGDMRELGARSEEEHRLLLDLIAGYAQFEEVILVGEEFGRVNRGCRWFATVGHLNQWLCENPLSGRTILVKGSNGTALFKAIDNL